MLCPNCAAPISDTAKFCSNCGTSVAFASSSPYSAASAQAEEASSPYQAQAAQAQAQTASQPQSEPTPFERGYQQGYAWASGEQAPQAEPVQQPYQQQTYQQPANPYAQTTAGIATKSKIAAGLLGIFLGSLGIHKFYLGYTTQGVIMLLVSLFTFGIGASIMAIIGIIEGIIYLVKTDDEFYYTYELGSKPWF